MWLAALRRACLQFADDFRHVSRRGAASHTFQQAARGLIEGIKAARLDDVSFVVTDLPNDLLVLAANDIIWVDQDAAGFGWFVEPTPHDDAEFQPGGAAAGRMDLLTVLAHELGHVLGYEHDSEPGHLMSDTLAPGVRLLPIGTRDDIDNVFTNPD